MRCAALGATYGPVTWQTSQGGRTLSACHLTCSPSGCYSAKRSKSHPWVSLKYSSFQALSWSCSLRQVWLSSQFGTCHAHSWWCGCGLWGPRTHAARSQTGRPSSWCYKHSCSWPDRHGLLPVCQTHPCSVRDWPGRNPSVRHPPIK